MKDVMENLANTRVLDNSRRAGETPNARAGRSGTKPDVMVNWSFSIYDTGWPSAAPDRSTPALNSAVGLEDSVRRDSDETGAFFARDGSLIIRKTGTPKQVSFTKQELVGTDGTLFTHNHPDDGTFSREDIVAAIQSRLIELRAVGPSLRHRMQAPGNGWPSIVAFDRALATAGPLAQQKTAVQLASGQLDPRYVPAEVCHQLWLEVARLLSLRYQREKS
jgi:hypothetical protein